MIPRTYIGRVWLFALFGMAIGLVLSIYNLPDRSSFARSGAFVTMLGIWTALRGLSEARGRLEVFAFTKALGEALIRVRRKSDPQTQQAELIAKHEKRIVPQAVV